MSDSRLHDLHLDCKGLGLRELEGFGEGLAGFHRGIRWYIGDVARYAEARFPDKWMQVFPEWMSPDEIARCAAVAKAYPPEKRNQHASWTIHMRLANDPRRFERVLEHVDAGRTSDEAAAADRQERNQAGRWLLAVDVNYFLHRYWYSGAGVESAMSLAGWIQRTAERLKKLNPPLTDVVCCFDHPRNHRKELTADWPDKYKDRPEKPAELKKQLELVRQLIEGHGFCCVSVDGMEADDCLASYAAQFEGKITLLSQDKDLRQCLSEKCNMLLDVEWLEGEPEPVYQWMTAKRHTEDTGIPPELWADYQALMGDNVDGITGAKGIGEKGAKDLIQMFGSARKACMEAPLADVLKTSQRNSLIDFADKLDATLQLVTLRTDLELPTNTNLHAGATSLGAPKD